MALMTWPLTSDGAGAVTYTANEWRTLLTNLFTEGILGAGSFAVTQRAAGANMQLDIAAGVAVLTGDDAAGQGRYLIRDDAADTEAVTISTANPTNPRIDRVGIQLRDPSEGGASGRDAIFSVVTGTAAASPSAPAAPDSFLTLALVAVAEGATSITNANITDSRAPARLVHEVVDLAAIAAASVGTSELVDESVTEGKLDPDVLSSDWATLSPATGWAVVAGTPLRYKKVGNIVYLQGVVSRSGATTTNSTAATLPVGFRPTNGFTDYTNYFLTAATGTRYSISTAGVITLVSVEESASYGIRTFFEVA